MKVEFVTRYYELAHGRGPRGTGSWAFGALPYTRSEDVFWAPSSLSYSDAKSAATIWAHSAGVDVVYVQT